jgi:hypothetical protein
MPSLPLVFEMWQNPQEECRLRIEIIIIGAIPVRVAHPAWPWFIERS